MHPARFSAVDRTVELSCRQIQCNPGLQVRALDIAIDGVKCPREGPAKRCGGAVNGMNIHPLSGHCSPARRARHAEPKSSFGLLGRTPG